MSVVVHKRENLIKISSDGYPGSQGLSYKKNGLDGEDGTSGGNASKVALKIFSLQNRIYITGLKLESPLVFALNRIKLEVSSRGGCGGNGKEGKNGANGANGANGLDGTWNNTPVRSFGLNDDWSRLGRDLGALHGGPGKNGFPGERGGNGGDGGDGGDGGEITLRVPSKNAYLLLLISSLDVGGGSGGEGGEYGKGGNGGKGGRGGFAGRWLVQRMVFSPQVTKAIYIDSYGRKREEVIDSSYSLDFPIEESKGCSGPPGQDGRDGPNGVAGRRGKQGRNGIVNICLEEETRGVAVYKEIFKPVISKFNLGRSRHQVFEPGAFYSLHKIGITNNSSMPIPKMDHPFTVGLGNDSGIVFDPQATLKVGDSINAHSSYVLPDSLKFQISPIQNEEIPANTVFNRTVHLSCTLNLPVIGWSKKFSGNTSITIQFPVKLLTPVVPKTIVPEKEVPFTFEVENVGDRILGINSPSKRGVKLRLTDTSENHSIIWVKDKEVHSLNPSCENNLPYVDSLEKTKVSGNFIFSLNAPTYKPIQLKAELLLEDVNCPLKMNVIQTVYFSAVVSKSFQWNPEADVILCVNRETPHTTIHRWCRELEELKLKCVVWDVSLYKGFEFSQVVDELRRPEPLKGKVLVVLNHMFTDEGKKILPTSFFKVEDLYERARETGIYIIGGDDSPLPVLSQEKEETFHSMKDFFSKQTHLLSTARIIVQDTRFLKPDLDVIHEKAKDVLNLLGAMQPDKRHSIEALPIKVLDPGCCITEYEYTYIVRQDRVPLVLQNSVEDRKVSDSGGELDLLQVLKLLPFQKKFSLFKGCELYSKRFNAIKEGILSSLIEDLLPYFRSDSSTPLSKEETERLLEKLSSFKDTSILVEDLILSYEHLLMRMKEQSSRIFNKRFAAIVQSSQILLKEIRSLHNIPEKSYQEVLKQLKKDSSYLRLENLLEYAINPTSSQATWFQKGVILIPPKELPKSDEVTV